MMMMIMICNAVYDGDWRVVHCRKIIELEEELKVVSNNMKSLEIAEQEARITVGILWHTYIGRNRLFSWPSCEHCLSTFFTRVRAYVLRYVFDFIVKRIKCLFKSVFSIIMLCFLSLFTFGTRRNWEKFVNNMPKIKCVFKNFKICVFKNGQKFSS